MTIIKRWRMHLQILEHTNIADDLDYDMSEWADWVNRIEEGHKVEEQSIARREAKRKEKYSHLPEDPNEGEYLAEEYSRVSGLTNSMYGALIVALWSEMEHFFVGISKACYWALEKKETALKAVSDFCNKTLDTAIDQQLLKGSIRQLKNLQGGIQYRIDDIEKSLHQDLQIDLKKITGYEIINAIRILNNSFKHNRGYYKPKHNKPDTNISVALVNKWGIEEKKRIDYSKLPIKELVLASSAFRKIILETVEREIAYRIEGSKSSP
jgi:hypothetical protein